MERADELVQAVKCGTREDCCRALGAIAQRGLGRGATEVLAAVLWAAEHEDPIVREWAVVALRTRGADPRVVEMLWRRYNRDDRQNIRCYAIESLGSLKQCLGLQDLRTLFDQSKDDPSNILLPAAVRGFGEAARSLEALELLHSLVTELARQEPASSPTRSRLVAACEAAQLRVARTGLGAGAFRRADLQDPSWQQLLAKLGEARNQNAIRKKAAQRQQETLFKEDGDGTDAQLDPSSPLKDNAQARYIQDLCEWKDLQFAQVRTYTRDHKLANAKKEAVGGRCQVCGEAQVAVDTHHMQLLSQGGPDTLDHLLVLPSAHPANDDRVQLVREEAALPHGLVRRCQAPGTRQNH